MKLLSLICLVGGFFVAYCFFPIPTKNKYTKQTQVCEVKKGSTVLESFKDVYHDNRVKRITQIVSTTSKDSTHWFEKHLGLLIEKQYFTFAPTKYVNPPTEKIKKMILKDEKWLGDFSIGNITGSKNIITINCSNEEKGYNKMIFITPNFLLISYSLLEDYGSALIYLPEEDRLINLDNIIVTTIEGDSINGRRKRFHTEMQSYVTECGRYEINSGKYVVEYTE